MADQAVYGPAWAKENTLSGAIRAHADRPASPDESFDQGQAADRLVARQQIAYRNATRQLEAEARAAGVEYTPPVFDAAARTDVALEAVKRSAAPKVTTEHVVVGRSQGYEVTQDVQVTALSSGMTWIDGPSPAVAAYLRKVTSNPFLQVGVLPETQHIEAPPQYPPTPRGDAAGRTWMRRFSDTPSGRAAARREAARLWAEAGLKPPDAVSPGVYMS